MEANEALIEAWVNFATMPEENHQRGIPSAKFQYWESLHALIRSNRREAWEVVKAIAARLEDDQSRAYLAAGPLEELLLELGDEAPRFFSQQDKTELRALLPFVWSSGLSLKTVTWIEELTRN